jgi:hypothetical protein
VPVEPIDSTPTSTAGVGLMGPALSRAFFPRDLAATSPDLLRATGKTFAGVVATAYLLGV